MHIAGAYLGFAFFCSEAGLAISRRSSSSSGSRQFDANSLRVLWIVNIASIMAGVWLASQQIGKRLPDGVPWAQVGTALFVVGTALRWWAIVHLGHFFTVDVAVAADHRVVDNGPYRLIRHPSYSGLLMQFLGLGLTLGTLPGVLAFFLPPFVTLLYRIGVEESALRHGLGKEYVNYMQRTTRLIPWVL